MKGLRMASLMLIAFAVLPELSRYAAERELYRATGLLMALQSGRSAGDSMALARSSVGAATSAARALPGDPRPWLIAGQAALFGGDSGQALLHLRRAQALAQRPEIDFALGRAYMLRRELAPAQVAFLHGGWVNPMLLSSLPPEAEAPLRAEIARSERRLIEGELTQPPYPASEVVP